MEIPAYITHYFEKDAGPLLNICDLDPQQRSEIIRREKNANTGFNRFSLGEEFFDFRLLADDLLLELYESKFGEKSARRPFYGVLGDADVVGGLYRDPYKIRIPITEFGPEDLTFMCPDHFHLVSFLKRNGDKKAFGYQLPKDFSESRYPYFGKLMTFEELVDGFRKLGIYQFLERQKAENNWYRYVEAQIWSEPASLRRKHNRFYEVTPEPWTYQGVTYLQNYKQEAQQVDE
ncbi:MAG: hypothetical protein GVY36_16860 [Verrucomicrobia bacterium]|jgi:hypothetical protein|nr:hypothetical protein [Verrucomicrobiota bacterium]